MTQAENWPKELKRTKQRVVVRQILCDARTPLSALEIFRKIGNLDGFAISTVYRILNVFEEKNMVQKTTLMGEEMARYSLQSDHHSHYATCLKCHIQLPIKNCPLEHNLMEMQQDDFVVTCHKIELYGYCKNCKQPAN